MAVTQAKLLGYVGKPIGSVCSHGFSKKFLHAYSGGDISLHDGVVP